MKNVTTTRTSKILSLPKKFLKFFYVLLGNKRATLGIGILIFFLTLSIAAPLLTPYDPVFDERLGGKNAAPVWFRYLPWSQALSENYELIEKPGFSTPVSLAEWDYTSTISEDISISYDFNIGSNEPGSMVITYNREGKLSDTKPKLYITKEFYYPYEGPPSRFSCQISFLPKTEYVPIEIMVFIKRLEEMEYPLWRRRFIYSTSTWTKPVTIDSYGLRDLFRILYNSTDPAVTVFSKPGNYKYGVEIAFQDNVEADRVKATVYIDDVNIRLYGSAFGLLGCDYKGRDLFTQLAHGSRISLFVGLLSAGISVVIGLTLGLIAGYLGGAVDEVLMRVSDMLLVLPGLPLLIVLSAALGASIYNIIFLIGFLGWMGFTRTVRSQVLSLKERPFVEAAKAVGAGKFHIIATHIVPNVVSLVYVALALSVPGAILAEAALSWLGLYDPTFMSWGRMLHDVQATGSIQVWWWVIPPGLCIAAVSLSFILIGYALDEIFNPKLRRRR